MAANAVLGIAANIMYAKEGDHTDDVWLTLINATVYSTPGFLLLDICLIAWALYKIKSSLTSSQLLELNLKGIVFHLCMLIVLTASTILWAYTYSQKS